MNLHDKIIPRTVLCRVLGAPCRKIADLDMAETFLPDNQKISQGLEHNKFEGAPSLVTTDQDTPSLLTSVQDTPLLVGQVQDTPSLVRPVPETPILMRPVQAATFPTMASQQDDKSLFLLAPLEEVTPHKDVTAFKEVAPHKDVAPCRDVASHKDVAHLQDINQETQAGELQQPSSFTLFKDDNSSRGKHSSGDHDYSTRAMHIKSEEVGLEMLCQEELDISLDSIMAEEASYQDTTEVASSQLLKSEESRHQFTEKKEIGNKVVKEEEAIKWLDSEQERINQLNSQHGYGNKLIAEWSTDEASYQIFNENEATPHFQLTVLEEKDSGIFKMGQPSEVRKAPPNPFTDLFSNRRKGQVRCFASPYS